MRRSPAELAPLRMVYVARFGDYLKVGSSVAPEQRVRRLRYGSPMARPSSLAVGTPGSLVAVIPGSYAEELRMQAALCDHHVTGEWFRLSSDSLLAVAMHRRAAASP